MELKNYLKQELAPSTVKRYLREIKLYFISVENHQTADYTTIVNYIGSLRKRQPSIERSRNVGCSLHAIKRYYSFLVATNQREDNPAKSIKLRDKISRDIQVQDLFKTKELELLLDRKERYPLLKNKNKIVLSLLIYQALKVGEIANLTLKNIDLEKGSIKIKGDRKTNSRTLKLESKQVFWLVNYLSIDRPKLLKIESDLLIISSKGTPQKGDSFHSLIESQKHLFPTRKLNPVTIRQSVITNLLKQGKDLRIVQVFAGHKYPSATENYKQTNLEQLKTEVLKYHPLQ
jgi:integrase/recombinase XerD